MLCSVADELIAQPNGQLRLPPSLERELKLRGKNAPRVIRFSDTVKADKLISQSIRDTSGEELDSTMVHDSAIVVIDSAVSLSHKEWLDSMLVELPETEHTPDGLRFHYPDEMMVNTTRRQVPFDESLPMKMDPVSKEDLPLFSSLPIQQPITSIDAPRFSFTAGGGSPYFPELSAKALLLNETQSTIEIGGSFVERVSTISAIKEHWDIKANSLFLFNTGSVISSAPKPLLGGELSMNSLTRDIKSDSGKSAYSLFRTRLGFNFTVGTLEAIKLTSLARLNYFSDNSSTGLAERSGKVSLLFEKQVTDSANRFSLGVDYNGASTTTDKLIGNAALGAATITAAISSNSLQSFYWKAGLTGILASDLSGTQSYFFPVLVIQERFSNRWSVFASLSRSATVQSFDDLFLINPFYGPVMFDQKDHRRVRVDNYMITGGVEYFLSPVDRLHLMLGYNEHHNQVAFLPLSQSLTTSHFEAGTFDTKNISLALDGQLLFFSNDRLTFSMSYASTRSVDDNNQLPYAPIVIGEVTYSFGSFSKQFFPTVGIKQLARSDKSLFFVNASTQYRLDSTWSLNATLINILDSDGAYWDSYTEYPRTITLSITGLF